MKINKTLTSLKVWLNKLPDVIFDNLHDHARFLELNSRKTNYRNMTDFQSSLYYLRGSTGSKLKNKTFHFELLSRWLNFYFITFEILTQSWKIKRFTSS